MRKKVSFSPAFTLIELLIVMTIIGILAVTLIPKIVGGSSRARDAQRKVDLQEISAALELYMTDNGTYPATPSGTVAYCVAGLDLDAYLTAIPTDPNPIYDFSASFCQSPKGDYTYRGLNTDGNSSTLEGYLLIASLEVDTKTEGSGIYAAGSLWSINTALSAAENLNALTLCGSTCNAVYVLGH